MSRKTRRILDMLESGPSADIGEVNDGRRRRQTSYFLYRHYDEDGKLLYVGITDQPARRLTEHERNAPWRGKIASVITQRFNSQQEAVVAERIAIHDENPIWNIDRHPVEREVMVPFQARLPERLHMKLAWLNRKLPGGPSMQELLLTGAERLADQLLARLAESAKVSVDELCRRMEAEMRGTDGQSTAGRKAN